MTYFYVLALLLYTAPLARLGHRGAYLLLGFTALLFFLGARWETGTDWFPYIEYFRNLDNFRNFEIGYVLFNETVRQFSDNYTLFLFLGGGIALAPIFWFLREESRGWVPLGVMIFYSYYYLITYFGASRRIIAIGLCVLAAMKLLEKKQKFAFLLIALGSFFHYSAIICILYFPLQRANLSIKGIFQIFVTITGAFIVTLILIPYLIKIDVFYQINSRVGEYLVGDTSVDGYNENVLSIFSIMKRSIFIIFVIFTYTKFKNKITSNESFFVNSYIFSFFIYLISEFAVGDIFKTFTIYFSIFEIVLIPNLIRKYQFNFRLILYILFMPYLILQTYTATFGNPFVDMYIPYRLAPEFGWIEKLT
jgi:transmembrane protein EpsG